jgi:hypothetical protein
MGPSDCLPQFMYQEKHSKAMENKCYNSEECECLYYFEGPLGVQKFLFKNS